MSWLRKFTKSGDSLKSPPVDLKSTNVCFEAFKSHWLQICDVINATCPSIQTGKNAVARIEHVTFDHIETTRNLLEQMVFLLIEELSSGELCGPIFEYVLHQNIFQKLNDWWEKTTSLKEQMMINLLKIYEVLISQAQHSLLHHNQLVNPMMKLLSSSFSPRKDPYESDYISRSEEMDGHIVVLLNLLCVWMNRDPSLLHVFFNSAQQGSSSFIIISLLIEFIHHNGSVGQQARDALLLCMALSNTNSEVAQFMVQYSNFCPVLATGLSALYSTLPRHMKVKDEDWHCLLKEDWSHVPELTNFMNSFQFCNSIMEVADESVSKQLLNFLYNGFLVSVVGPSLHKTSAEEVVVTTAYLNLFLRSITAPPLMRCFLSFLLTHRHESSLIINTLIQRIASNNRLAVVSLSLIRTLIDLNCEDFLLQLVLRYLIPCQHILVSQRHAICDVDMYNASALRFLALTPSACIPDATTQVSFDNTGSMCLDDCQDLDSPEMLDDQPDFGDEQSQTPERNGSFNGSISSSASQTVNSLSTMAEFGPDLKSQWDLNTSYMDYLEDARQAIERCTNACVVWSASYNGKQQIEALICKERTDSSKSSTIIPHSSSEISSVKSDIICINQNNDPTQKALSAAYKAMSLTTLALSGNSSIFNNLNSNNITPTESVDVKNRSQTYPSVDSKSILQTVQSAASEGDFNNNKDNIDNANDDNQNDSKNLNIETCNGDHIQTGSDKVERNQTRSYENLSVDDFFRSLMDIVPKSTVDLMERKSEKMSTEDDDTESIDVTSSVDLLSPVHSNNPIEKEDKIDTLTSDLKEKEDIKMDEDEDNIDMDAMENSQNDYREIVVEGWRKESFTEDTDDENRSSSFYESNEFTPTHISVAPTVPLKLQGIPYTGPLMGTLFAKLDQMVSNSLYENLLLTGIITRLAIFPQPLLRSFLLNTQMIFQPSVRSLYQVLNSARNKIEAYGEKVNNFPVLVCRAQKYLMARGTIPLNGDPRFRVNPIKDVQLVVPKVHSRTTTISDMFLRRKQSKKKTTLHEDIEALLKMTRRETINKIDTSKSMFYVQPELKQHKENEERKLKELRTKNAVYACIILSEFVKELAAIAQEHAVLHL